MSPELPESIARALAQIEGLPEQEQIAALLHGFCAMVRTMPPDAVRALRADLLPRIPPGPPDCDVRTLLTEILDGHLALRDLQADE